MTCGTIQTRLAHFINLHSIRSLIINAHAIAHAIQTVQSSHPECAERIRTIWELLRTEGVAERCTRLPVRAARVGELELAHTREHVDKMLEIPSHSDDDLQSVSHSYNSLYLCRDSLSSALLSAGGVLAAVDAVVGGTVRNAVAVVDPNLLESAALLATAATA